MKWAMLTALLLSIFACSEAPPKKVVIAINPWPGYELLYLAEKKGFFEEQGLNIELVQMATLTDAQRAYLSGRVDGFTSSIVEAVQIVPLGGKPIKVVLVPDYSNGGDVIIANNTLPDMKSLKGQAVGCEVSGLGLYVLSRALNAHGLLLDDVNVINVEQVDAARALRAGEVSAMVSYPPFSISLLSELPTHTIFTSREIPEQIVDVVSLDEQILIAQPEFVPKLWRAWQSAIGYLQANPEESIALMAQREVISPENFQSALNELYLLDSAAQQEIFANAHRLENIARSVCSALKHIDALDSDCGHVVDMFDISGGR